MGSPLGLHVADLDELPASLLNPQPPDVHSTAVIKA